MLHFYDANFQITLLNFTSSQVTFFKLLFYILLSLFYTSFYSISLCSHVVYRLRPLHTTPFLFSLFIPNLFGLFLSVFFSIAILLRFLFFYHQSLISFSSFVEPAVAVDHHLIILMFIALIILRVLSISLSH